MTSVISQDSGEIAYLNALGYTTINVAQRFDSNLTDGYRSNIRTPSGNGYFYADASGWEAGHESGHVANLPDQYSYKTMLPFDGYTHNVMGVYGGAVDSRNVAGILNRALGVDIGTVSVHGEQASIPLISNSPYANGQSGSTK